jgi:hypothetical protein
VKPFPPEIVLTSLVQFDLDRIATAVFRINYGGFPNCPKMTEEDLRVLCAVVMNPNYTIAHEDFPLLDEPLLARLEAVARGWWRSPLHTYEQIWSGSKSWVCKEGQQSIILELFESFSPRRKVQRHRWEESPHWDCDWSLFHFVVLVENGCRYICEALHRAERRHVESTLNIKAVFDKYMESVLQAFSDQSESSFLRLFNDFVEFTPVAESIEGGEDGGEDDVEDGDVRPVWRRPARLLPAILDSIVGLAGVSLLRWKENLDPTLDFESFPPISNPTAATLPHIVMKELDVSFIESGPFKISSTPYIDEHLTFDPETETISIYNDFPTLYAAYERVKENHWSRYQIPLDWLTDILVES